MVKTTYLVGGRAGEGVNRITQVLLYMLMLLMMTMMIMLVVRVMVAKLPSGEWAGITG